MIAVLFAGFLVYAGLILAAERIANAIDRNTAAARLDRTSHRDRASRDGVK